MALMIISQLDLGGLTESMGDGHFRNQIHMADARTHRRIDV